MKKTTHDILRDRLMRKAGLTKPQAAASLKELAEKNWSPEFEELMRNRLIMGAIRYNNGQPWPQMKKYDFVSFIYAKTKLFEETGNLEALVDVANCAMLEFVFTTHPNAHFEAMDDTQMHVSLKK